VSGRCLGGVCGGVWEVSGKRLGVHHPVKEIATPTTHERASRATEPEIWGDMGRYGEIWGDTTHEGASRATEHGEGVTLFS